MGSVAIPEEISMLVNKASDREWKATDYPGIDQSLFRNNETGGRSSVFALSDASIFVSSRKRTPAIE
jgi:hypothetical protein